ncbi:hypothetical protein [Ammoniphilus sp. 3BR4]
MPLPIDFAVFDKTGEKLVVPIEYDGQQHFCSDKQLGKGRDLN